MSSTDVTHQDSSMHSDVRTSYRSRTSAKSVAARMERSNPYQNLKACQSVSNSEQQGGQGKRRTLQMAALA